MTWENKSLINSQRSAVLKNIALVEKNGQKWFINENGENILHDKFDNIGTITVGPYGWGMLKERFLSF